MKTSEIGLNLIKHYEGFYSKPYRCPAGLWTIGYGHVINDGRVLPADCNRVFLKDEINALLTADLKRFERGVALYCPVQLTQNQFDALVSFSFNLGLGTLQRSKVRQRINRKDVVGAANVLLKYNTARGKVLKGLDLRRKDEYALLMSNQYGPI
jgi:lysozyme